MPAQRSRSATYRTSGHFRDVRFRLLSRPLRPPSAPAHVLGRKFSARSMSRKLFCQSLAEACAGNLAKKICRQVAWACGQAVSRDGELVQD